MFSPESAKPKNLTPLNLNQSIPTFMQLVDATKNGALREMARSFAPSFKETQQALKSLEPKNLPGFLNTIIAIVTTRQNELWKSLDTEGADKKLRLQINTRMKLLALITDSIKKSREDTTVLLDKAAQLVADLGVLLNKSNERDLVSDKWLPKYPARDYFEDLVRGYLDSPSKRPSASDYGISPKEMNELFGAVDEFLHTPLDHRLTDGKTPKSLPGQNTPTETE